MVNKKNEKAGRIQYDQEWYDCEIVYEGTQSKCNKKCSKYIARQNHEVNTTEDEAFHRQPPSKKQKLRGIKIEF